MTTKKWTRLGLLALTTACGAPLEGEPQSGEPLGSEDGALSVFPKGQIALTETSHSDPAQVFSSWGYIYHRPADESASFELLTRPGSYPKALAAVTIPPSCCDPAVPKQCIFWLQGQNVQSKCETDPDGWGANTTFSSATVHGGEIRRLVGASEPGAAVPALVALNTANKVLINWYRNHAWQGWCVARTGMSSDMLDLAAYQSAAGTISYQVNRTRSSPTRTEFYRSHVTAFDCPNLSGNPGLSLTTSLAPLPRFTATANAVFAIDTSGDLVQFFDGGAFVTSMGFGKDFLTVAYRRVHENGQALDSFYALATDGSAWRSHPAQRTADSVWHTSWDEMP